MSSAVPQEPGRNERPHESAPETSAGPGPTPRTPNQESRYLNRELVEKLVADLVTGESAGRFRARLGHSFDRADAELRIAARSVDAAERAMAEARARDVVPPEPMLPDTELRADLETRVYKARGYSHYLIDLPYQDSHAVRYDSASRTHCSVVADGVSSVPLSHHAAAIMADAVARIAEDLATDASGEFRENGSVMNAKFLHALYARTAGAYLDLCQETGYHPEEAAERFLATTLQLSVITPAECVMVALSDGIFSFADSYKAVTEVIERHDPGFNTPPLLERVILAEAIRQREGWDNALFSELSDTPSLVREAEAFHVVGYGATSDVVPSVVEMGTDGGQYTDMLPQHEGKHFPLVRLAKDDDRNPCEIETAILLTHLYRLGEKLSVVEHVERRYVDALQRQGDQSIGEAEMLKAFLREVDEDALSDARTMVRDFLRTVPGGRLFTHRFSGSTPTELFESSLEGLRKEIELESFSQFLEGHRSRLERTILEVSRDITGNESESGPARRFGEAIAESVVRSRASNNLAAVELEDWGWVMGEADASTVLELLEREPVALLGLRREVVRGVITSAEVILREDFAIEAGEILTPVSDDITWIAVGLSGLDTGGSSTE